jgi:CheY-like chemotaxis protein
MATLAPFKILLVDDNESECYLFNNALSALSISSSFSSVDGKGLMDYMSNITNELPDVIFLDLNMPCKNGFECLEDLKLNKNLQHIPVIIYSTSFEKTVADELYKMGAHYYVQKTNVTELQRIILAIFSMHETNTFLHPSREKFALSIKPSKVLNPEI